MQYYARHPVNATFTGIHTHDHLLPDWSAAARAADAQEMHALHAALLAAWPRTDAITWRHDPDALDAELARANLELRLAEIASGHFVEGNPALWTGEAIFGVVALMIRPFAAAEERVPAIIARLNAIPAFIAPLAQTIPAAPTAWIARAQRECEAAQRLFSTGLARWAADAGLPPAHTAAIESAAAPARAAFVATAAVLEALPRVDERPVGVEFLSLALRRGHFVHRSLPELRTAIDHPMRDARARLASMSADAGGWATASAAMAADHPTAEGYLESFTRRWQECHAHALAHDLVSWSDWPIRYVPIPTWAQEVAPTLYWLFYRSPAPFDPYTTYDYVVTPIDATLDAATTATRLRAWNHSTITLNHVVHHGAIGHHVQNWHATHRSRSRLGTIAAVDCASRIGMFLGGSMAEGWACYATDLMDETGFLTPLERLS
ncbi:MAG: DUF885 domain-containing protein, partial [Gemmatimonadaceae bacterium]|nr:DUF885 domain-containing protein [Gemmatimonadaceae bacterium]